MHVKTIILAGLLALLGVRVWRGWRQRKLAPPLPPGPPPLPLLGNVLDLPAKGSLEFRHWLKHKDIYGPISSVTVLGQTLVLIHDKKAAHDLLDKHSTTTSGRPQTEFASRLCGFGDFLLFQQDNNHFRRGRKLVNQELGTKAAAARFKHAQDVHVRRFLIQVLKQPESSIKHLKTMAGAIILRAMYGYTAHAESDPLVNLAERMVSNLALAAMPFAWPVDAIPVLKYLPGWFPGAAFKKTAQRYKQINQAFVDIPYDFVRRQMARETYNPSYVSNLVNKLSGNQSPGLVQEDEHAVKHTAAIMYAGGVDTTASALSSFVLAMVMFPEVQRKAQQEIDEHVGTHRLPVAEDRDNLPYVNGIVKESLRWSPITPLGFPHVATVDTIYGHYLIPKGATILPSVWWFLHDPDVYDDPETFDPGRYLEPRNEPDPVPEVFGYGRRACPGRYFADGTAFLAIVRLLAIFDIRAATDEEGRQQEVKLNVQPGLGSFILPFPHRIAPRGKKQVNLVARIETEYPWEESDASHLGIRYLAE